MESFTTDSYPSSQAQAFQERATWATKSKTSSKQTTRLQEQQKKERPDSFLRFTGLAFTMAGTIAACVGLGYWADKSWETSPFLTISGAIVGVFASLYLTIKDLTRK